MRLYMRSRSKFWLLPTFFFYNHSYIISLTIALNWAPLSYRQFTLTTFLSASGVFELSITRSSHATDTLLFLSSHHLDPNVLFSWLLSEAQSPLGTLKSRRLLWTCELNLQLSIKVHCFKNELCSLTEDSQTVPVFCLQKLCSVYWSDK